MVVKKIKPYKNLIYSFPQSYHFCILEIKSSGCLGEKKEMGDTEVFCAREGPAGSCSVSAEVQQAQVTCHEKVPPGRARTQASKVSTCNKDEKDSSYQFIF